MFSFQGLSLWFYLLAACLDASVDTAGVFLAVLADLTKGQKQSRAMVNGLLGVCFALSGGLGLALGAAVSARRAAQALLLMALLRLAALGLLPETAPCQKPQNGLQLWGLLQDSSAIGAHEEAWELLQRVPLLWRLAVILCLAFAGVTGRQMLLRPYLASHFGANKADLERLILIAVPGAVASLAFLLPKLAGYEMAALKASLGAAAFLTLGVAACGGFWQVLGLYALLAGPSLMFAPLVSALKANLVSDAEQGKVQGLLAALRSFASAGTGAAVSSVGFRPGGRDRGSLRGGLYLVAILEFVATLLAVVSLPGDGPLDDPDADVELVSPEGFINESDDEVQHERAPLLTSERRGVLLSLMAAENVGAVHMGFSWFEALDSEKDTEQAAALQAAGRPGAAEQAHDAAGTTTSQLAMAQCALRRWQSAPPSRLTKGFAASL
ncbi:unnamed protein product [Effrenium voratum]|nr:unnamed protein product [Effrenium voratum]